MNKRILFNGHELWFLEEEDGSGGLAPLSQCDEQGRLTTWRGDLSYAHVMRNGAIMRYGIEIGHRDDFIEVNVIETTARKV